MEVKFRCVRKTAIKPKYQTDGAVGLDLHADTPDGGLFVLPGESCAVGTGIAVQIPRGFEGHVSGRPSNTRRGLVAQTGTIDSDYRGEIKLIVLNLTDSALVIFHGDRVGQLVISRVGQLIISPVSRVELIEGDLDDTTRGAGGFGSTGEY